MNGKNQRGFAPTLERLEGRDLMASSLTASLSGGVLSIEGTTGADQIYVREFNGFVESYITIDNVKIKVKGKLEGSVSSTSVDRIEIRALGGNDTISLNCSSYEQVHVDAKVWAGMGNDSIYGGSGDDVLYGDAGNDLIYGNGGDDTLFGNAGADKLYGHTGDDWLYGGTAGVAGATAAEIDLLDGGADFDRYSDGFDFKKPVFNGAAVTDIEQNGSPTCQTLAALATAVSQGMDIGKNFKFLGNNKYSVNLHGLGKQTIFFDGTWSDNDPMPVGGAPEFWTILMQRGRLQGYGVNWNAEMTDAQWDAANQQSGGKLLNSGTALYDVTGWTAAYTAIANASAQKLADARKRGDFLVASSNGDDKKGLTADGIVRGHAYAIIDVYKSGGKWMVKLYNPWGQDGTAIADKADDGFITLSWAQFANSANFRGYNIA